MDKITEIAVLGLMSQDVYSVGVLGGLVLGLLWYLNDRTVK